MSEKAIAVRGLTVRFNGITALQDIDLDINQGTFNAVVGPNGSGKTTLLKTLLGLIRPGDGDVRIFGKRAGRAPAEWIGYIPQVKTIDRSFPAIAIELVASGLRKSWPGIIKHDLKKTAYLALSKVNAENLANRTVAEMSGGELQRIFLARAIVRKPRILLLDEPATGIDMVCETTINRLLDDMHKKEGMSVIMVTHNWETARHHADYVLLLNKQLIVYDKTETALSSDYLGRAFRHIGQEHHNDSGDNYV